MKIKGTFKDHVNTMNIAKRQLQSLNLKIKSLTLAISEYERTSYMYVKKVTSNNIKSCAVGFNIGKLTIIGVQNYDLIKKKVCRDEHQF